MKSICLLLCLSLASFTTFAQVDSAAILKDIKGFQDALNKEYKSPETSPLPQDKRAVFTQINFFRADLQYRVTAKFTRTPDEKIFKMPTTGNEKKVYINLQDRY